MSAFRSAASADLLVSLAIVYSILIPYVFMALKRVYREPAGRTFVKCLVLLVLAFAVDAVVNIAAILLTVALT